MCRHARRSGDRSRRQRPHDCVPELQPRSGAAAGNAERAATRGQPQLEMEARRLSRKTRDLARERAAAHGMVLVQMYEPGDKHKKDEAREPALAHGIGHTAITMARTAALPCKPDLARGHARDHGIHPKIISKARTVQQTKDVARGYARIHGMVLVTMYPPLACAKGNNNKKDEARGAAQHHGIEPAKISYARTVQRVLPGLIEDVAP